MTRKMRYRQVLRHRCANWGKGVYAQQVRLQQSFFKEDKSFNLDISKVREIHNSLGTWDKFVEWRSYDWMKGSKGCYNRLILRTGRRIHPKANYKPIKKVITKIKAYMEKKAQEDIWKEQERRAEEFFNSMGV